MKYEKATLLPRGIKLAEEYMSQPDYRLTAGLNRVFVPPEE